MGGEGKEENRRIKENKKVQKRRLDGRISERRDGVTPDSESKIEDGIDTKHTEYRIGAALSNTVEQNIDKDYR